MTRPIGIFDSGVGGLTVLKELQRKRPHEHYIYVGDNAHCPYGEKTSNQLIEYSKYICDYFISQNVKLIVLACNTTSATILDDLRLLYPEIPIVGVIDSTVDAFIDKNIESVLVIATEATIQSHKYRETLLNHKPQTVIEELATPLLVPLIESGDYKKGIDDVLLDYLSDYQNLDSIILGCTHYPIIIDQIKKVYKDKIYISSGEAIVGVVDQILPKEDTNVDLVVSIYTTGDAHEFYKASKDFYEYNSQRPKKFILKENRDSV